MKKYTQKEVEERVFNKYNNEYRLVSKYKTMKDPATLLHIPCGNRYNIGRLKSFLNEGNCLCPNCKEIKTHSTKKLTEEVVIDRLKKETGDEYQYVSNFKNSNTKMILFHNICKKEFEVTPHMFFGKKKTRCPYCSNLNRGKYAIKENYLENIINDSIDENEYEWLEDYKNNNKLKHKIIHKKCGNIYYVRPNDFQQGYRCPKCSLTNASSKLEKEVYNFIKDNSNYRLINNYRIKNKEIDIYLPELKLGFEFNGTYWHSTRIVKDKNKHINKKNFFKEKGIDVYFIDEIDWLKKNEIIKSKILHIINQSKAKRIYARKTKVKYNLSNEKKKSFLNKNHIQGNCVDKFNLYLSYNKKVVAIMTFGCRINTNNSKKLELLRYATSKNYIVIGGFSKLLKHSIEYIIKNYPEYDEIITYADLNWSKGNLYESNGFILDHISKPSYFFVYKNKKINRFSLRKSELKRKFPDYYKEELTESQITKSIPNLLKIYNCGNLVYRYRIKNKIL